ncbi:hypothetical protein D9757_005083 [Collybiopsis confluens]|uniref:HORMA domain-containing protein n=1 Tax=Collybiopsis confluens TaxID=2823264 RepID=A0A8H5HT61_9AGAR|nr:hypothetical protein D9757_005083 [Collybiopsis confluens]
MQTQVKRRTEAKSKAAISSAQSLVAIQTLLKAGLGCITYMRDLLPQDNFTDCHLTTNDDSVGLSQSGSTSTASSPPGYATANKPVNGFKIMTMSRGYTDEADRLLNYLEYGIFDALQKQYLKSFIFAIYLDSEDPNNIVEAYTFNFQYHTLPGTDAVVPVMSLGDELQRMSLQGMEKDPVLEAARRGVPPTLKDVKRSVKTLLKTLISSMNHMETLPRRRYATFKLFYTDDTPSEYEPPHFKAGDYQRDKWYFSTRDMDEVPDTWPLGKLDAGWHQVDVKVSSIAVHLPSTSTEHDNKAFTGLVDRSGLAVPPRLSPAQEMAQRAEEIQQQTIDAQNRRIIWAAEDDPNVLDGVNAVGSSAHFNAPDFIRKPIGIKDDDGVIRDLASLGVEDPLGESHYSGTTPQIPRLHEIQNAVATAVDSDFPQTQLVSSSGADGTSEYRREAWNGKGKENHVAALRKTTRQVSDAFSLGDMSEMDTSTPCPTRKSRVGVLPPSSVSPPASPSPTQRMTNRTESIEMAGPEEEKNATGLMKQLALYRDEEDAIEDEEMLDLETQVVDSIVPRVQEIESINSPDRDPIESFGSDRTPSGAANQKDVTVAHPGSSSLESAPAPAKVPKKKFDSDKVECECGIPSDEKTNFQQEDNGCCGCETCGKWYHIWCMGYHSISDSRMPEDFVCFDCRVHADPSWELIKVELYSTLITKFRELATFRRAIKIAERNCPLTAVEFAKVMDGSIWCGHVIGCDNIEGRQLIKRLETEGFIAEETDGETHLQIRSKGTRGRGGKGKAKQTKTRRGLQKQKFVFSLQAIHTQEYEDYFDPTPDVEYRLLGVPQTKSSLKARKAASTVPPPPQVMSPELGGTFPQTQSIRTQSQTQNDMDANFYSIQGQGLKRSADSQGHEGSPGPKKKVKISIARGIDLAE